MKIAEQILAVKESIVELTYTISALERVEGIRDEEQIKRLNERRDALAAARDTLQAVSALKNVFAGE